ncbi:MAG: hypothetical protein RI958_1847 [Actinomycetota bacterium]|jgi:glycosyltransferase involved in cell wall biosynthesis
MRCWRSVSANSSPVSDDVTAALDPLVVVPAFNEVACIADVVRAVRAGGWRVLVIDDGSTDGTAAAAQQAGAAVLTLPINLGVGGALRTGFRYAVEHGERCIVQVDADGQHDAEQISGLLRELETTSADMVVGSRFAGGGSHSMSRVRRWSISLLASVAARTAGIRVTDPTSGFRAIRSPLLEAFAEEFPQYYLGDTWEATVVAARRGYRITEVPVSMRQRQGGSPSADVYASIRSMVRALATLVIGPSIDLPERPR